MKTMIDEMVSRFLCWKLPKDFGPDAGIRFAPSPLQTHDGPYWPTGTNLFHAGQAQEMFEHCVPPTWHPMATAPKDGTVVLGLVKGSDIPHPMRWAGHWWQSSWDHHDFFHDEPWCWMAIPDSPNPNDLNSGD